MNWINVKDALPPENCGFILVTNNIEARSAFGNMSHVWLSLMLHKHGEGYFSAFAHPSLSKVEYITHWCLAAPAVANGAAELPPPADGERSMFEREMLRLDICDDEYMIRRHDGSYVDDCDQAAWMAWQAGRLVSETRSIIIKSDEFLVTFKPKDVTEVVWKGPYIASVSPDGESWQHKCEEAERALQYWKAKAKIVAYGQACAKAAAATNPLAPNALLVAALQQVMRPYGIYDVAVSNAGALQDDFMAVGKEIRAALASVPTASEA